MKKRIAVGTLKSINKKTKVVAINFVSNTMGYSTPIKEIIRLAHEVAQSYC